MNCIYVQYYSAAMILFKIKGSSLEAFNANLLISLKR